MGLTTGLTTINAFKKFNVSMKTSLFSDGTVSEFIIASIL